MSDLTLDAYQALSGRTAGADPDPLVGKLILSNGLTGEAAEVLELAVGLSIATGRVADDVKKEVGHRHDLDREKRMKEYGDVLWYLQRLAYADGFTLGEVAEANLAKLQARYPEGFSSEASRNRSS